MMLGTEQLVLLPLVVVVAVSVGISLLLTHILVNSVQKAHRQQLQKMQATLNVVTSGSLGMGQKMLTLEKRLAKLRETQNEMKNGDVEFSYTQAQQLLARGADDRTIAANSGLTATEIKLMRMLQPEKGKAGVLRRA